MKTSPNDVLNAPTQPLARQLVMCLDGTSNSFDHLPTNVLRLFASVPTSTPSTLAYYDPGVGTFGLKETLFEWQKTPARVLGLAVGWGIRRSVENAYRFLAEQYREGDEIYLFGFSRGAYAARCVAALVHAVGLLPAHQMHLFDYAWATLTAPDSRGDPDFKLQAKFRSMLGRKVKVHFLGLFDTVKSVGWIYNPLVVPYSATNPSVERVRQAVALDEQRYFFRQNLWSATTGWTDVKQVWFAGVHADIGGGYPPEQSQLALLSYRWMLGEAMAAGLRVDQARCRTQVRKVKEGAQPLADIHQSLKCFWHLAEWLPQRTWDEAQDKHLWRLTFGKPAYRTLKPDLLIHRSVQLRQQQAAYAPPNLLPHLQPQVVDDDPLVAWL